MNTNREKQVLKQFLDGFTTDLSYAKQFNQIDFNR